MCYMHIITIWKMLEECEFLDSVVREVVPTRNEVVLMLLWYMIEELVMIDEAKVGALYSLMSDHKTLAQFLGPSLVEMFKTLPARHVNAALKDKWSRAKGIWLSQKVMAKHDRLRALAADQGTSSQPEAQQFARKVQDALVLSLELDGPIQKRGTDEPPEQGAPQER